MQTFQDLERLRIVIRGAVQGVGFRPFVYRLATEMALPGWVSNSPQGVQVEVEGSREALRAFLRRLDGERPPRAVVQSLEQWFLPPRRFAGFEIRESDGTGARTALLLPDIASCADCLREVFDPRDRRHRYPFTNCTNCGPRFSIILGLPYDRERTTMARFRMCDACRGEYEDPSNRRFHAQPNACPACGPQLALWHADGQPTAVADAALRAAATALREGRIVAVKGLGGFHLMVAAGDEAAVRRLRERKHREEKPLALMAPSLAWIRARCAVSDVEERLLRAPEAPIVLLARRRDPSPDGVAPSVAPRNPALGVMLPYTPLHALLLEAVGSAVVATSGNVADEPICTDESEALARLRGMADDFLVHDRPIARHVDDSVVRVLLDRELVLRRARGYAPLPVPLGRSSPPVLAVGAHLKNAVGLAVGGDAFVSQHVGDLETAEALAAFRRVARELPELYEVAPAAVACDLHPDYLSTQHAKASGLPVIAVQHHVAHVLACMAENEVGAPALGVAWDGTGYGPDGTIWGGEFLQVTPGGWSRLAHLRTFPLPGGDAAVKEPRRSAVGLLYELLGEALFAREDLPLLAGLPRQERAVLAQMLTRSVNAPRTSSIGRLFDAAAAILDLRQSRQFEGQAAMELEWSIGQTETDEAYPVALRPTEPIVLDWGPLVEAMLADRGRSPVGVIAARFHNALVEAIVAIARCADARAVVLSGGCFQNRYLTERAVSRLRAEGFQPYWHQRVPPNDGGIALGQLVAAATWSVTNVPGDSR